MTRRTPPTPVVTEGNRTTEEREAARRERELRRAEREGRRPRYEEAAEEFAASPPMFDQRPADGQDPSVAGAPPVPATPPVPAAAPVPATPPVPPAAPAPEPEPVAPLPLTVEREPDPPAADLDPEPSAADAERSAADAERSAADVDPADVGPDGEPLVTERDAPRRLIKSFPSPPDPALYVPDDELEVPAGTRRVSRRSRGRAGGGAAPPRRPPRSTRGRDGTPGPAKRHPWRGRIAALFFLVLAAAIIWFAIELFQPFGTSPHGRVTVRIAPMTSSSAVGRQLASDGVIASAFFFEARATLAGDRGKIRAGTYHLRKGMSYGSALSRLTAAPRAAPTSQLTIAEGHTRQSVNALLRHQKVRGNYLVATRHSRLLNPRHYGAPRTTPSLEGFLFPDTFTLVDPPKVSTLVHDQLKDFKRRFATVKLGYAHRHHLSDYDVLTIASLIEGEAARPHDRPLVASVIYNRLRDGMMLQLDSTTRYATGNFTRPLTESQLRSASPYNTRNHTGLPPTPIDSPGMAAIDAAAHPATSRYLYFFTKPCTNQAVFADSYAQFQNLLIRDKRTHCG